MTRSSAILSLMFASCAAVSALKADTLVVPNELASTPGNFAQNPFGGSGIRWLNVYNPNQFLPVLPEGARIDQISFRIDENDRNAFTATLPDIEIRMSTSPSLAPDLPVPFAEIHGADEKVVFPRGSATFSVIPAKAGPNPFLITFPLMDPFDYDPRKGSLAVDLLIYEQVTMHSLLADATALDSIAAIGAIGLSRSSGMGGALVLQVHFSPVPEPSAWLIAISGTSVLLLLSRVRI